MQIHTEIQTDCYDMQAGELYIEMLAEGGDAFSCTMDLDGQSTALFHTLATGKGILTSEMPEDAQAFYHSHKLTHLEMVLQIHVEG